MNVYQAQQNTGQSTPKARNDRECTMGGVVTAVTDATATSVTVKAVTSASGWRRLPASPSSSSRAPTHRCAPALIMFMTIRTRKRTRTRATARARTRTAAASDHERGGGNGRQQKVRTVFSKNIELGAVGSRQSGAVGTCRKSTRLTKNGNQTKPNETK